MSEYRIGFYDAHGYVVVMAKTLHDAEVIARMLGIHDGIGWVEVVDYE